MGSIFRVLYRELLSLGTLFFVIVPFVMSMSDDYSARQHLDSMKAQTHSAISSTYNGAKNNFSFAAPSMGMSSGGGGTYVSGGPIHIPQQ